jgi:hypothetical protein
VCPLIHHHSRINRHQFGQCVEIRAITDAYRSRWNATSADGVSLPLLGIVRTIVIADKVSYPKLLIGVFPFCRVSHGCAKAKRLACLMIRSGTFRAMIAVWQFGRGQTKCRNACKTAN